MPKKDFQYINSGMVADDPVEPATLFQDRRKISISRSGRFKSRNKQRGSLDFGLFNTAISKESEKLQPNNTGSFGYEKENEYKNMKYSEQNYVERNKDGITSHVTPPLETTL